MLSKATVKYIQSLQHKKFREEHGCFIAEGPKVVEELLASGNFYCKNIFATSEWYGNPGKTNITIVSDHELEKLATYTTPNKVIAEFEMNASHMLPLEDKISLMLDGIRDPGNLGTIIRTADWFNINQIICSPDTVEMYNPKVVQSTMASLGRVNVIYTELQSVLSNAAVESYAAVLDGEPIQKSSKVQEGIIVIGNESNGISESVIMKCNHKISIPKLGKAESLNAAIATAIFCYQFT